MMFILLLTGCSQEPIGEFVGMKVKEKRTEEHCSRGCWNEYFVTFEKNETKVELQANDESQFNVLEKGNIVDITYNEDYVIKDIEFPALEDDKK